MMLYGHKQLLLDPFNVLHAPRRDHLNMKNRMKNTSLAFFMIGLLLWSQGCQRSSQSNQANVSNPNNSNTSSPQSNAPQTHLKVGDVASDFTLNDTNGTPVKLSDFRGKKNVVLAFYVMAFTGG
jgi:cytochrome oxidase Cu insertion factor (SCO1/SenC/PrrC family)